MDAMTRDNDQGTGTEAMTRGMEGMTMQGIEAIARGV